MAKLKKLSNLKAHEVSLVQRGANRKPFFILKSAEHKPGELTPDQEARIFELVEAHAERVAKDETAPLSDQTKAALVACYRILLPVRDQITEGMIDELVAELDPVEDDEADLVDDSEVGNDIDQPERIDMQPNVRKDDKGGEGSRGGHVIGHTKSGKPIYESGEHTGSYSKEDHGEAHLAHLNHTSGNNSSEEKRREHRDIGNAHFEAARSGTSIDSAKPAGSYRGSSSSKSVSTQSGKAVESSNSDRYKSGHLQNRSTDGTRSASAEKARATAGGKAVIATHPDFTAQDHHDAAAFHRDKAAGGGSTKSGNIARAHTAAASLLAGKTKKSAGDGDEDQDMAKEKFDPEEQFKKAAGDWKKPDGMDDDKWAKATKAAKDAFGKACKADEDDDEDEDDEEVEKSSVAKSALDGLPAEARAYFEQVRKADKLANRALVQKAASLEAEMRSMKGEAVLKSYESRVESEFPALSIDAKETAKVLKSLADTNMAAHDHYLETLRLAHEQVKGSGIFKSVGHTPGANSRNSGFVAKATGGSAEQRLDALVAGYVAKGEAADTSAAWAKAMQTEEGIRLYEQRAIEQGGF